MTVYTLRNKFMNYKVYGYETSQAYRHILLDSEGIENKFIICQPFINVFWWKRLEAMGFNLANVVVVPHTFSDLSDRVHSMSEADFENSLQGSYEVVASHLGGKTYKFTDYYLDTMVNASGCVTSYSKRDFSLKTFERGIVTERLFYVTDGDGNFEYLNRDGSIALSGSKFDGACYYQLPNDEEEWYSEEELTTMYVKGIAKEGDIFLNDSMQDQWKELAQWLSDSGMSYYSFLHYDHFNAKGTLEKYDASILPNDKFMVASPYIVEDLVSTESTGNDFKPLFVHPVGVSVKKEVPDGIKSSKFMLASHLNKIKRVDMAVKAFIALIDKGLDISLDIYGSTLNEFESAHKEFEGILSEEPYASRIVFKGVFDSNKIPRQDYLGYISCSETEMYANALVECLAEGLIPVLSHTPYTHTPVLQGLNLLEVSGFNDEGGLVQALKNVMALSNEERADISKRVLEFANTHYSHSEARKSLLSFLGYSDLI